MAGGTGVAARARLAACAAAAGWRVAVADRPAGPRGRPGAVGRRRSTRPPRGRSAPRCCTRPRRSPGTDERLVARRARSGSARSCCPSAAPPRPDPAALAAAVRDGVCAREGWACSGGPAAVRAPRPAGALPRGPRRAVAGRRPTPPCSSGWTTGWRRTWRRAAARADLAASTSPPPCAGCCRGPPRPGSDELAPERLSSPHRVAARGSTTPTATPPVLAREGAGGLRLADTPTVLDGRVRVVLHLLSPARPAGRRHLGPRVVLAAGLPAGPGRPARPLPAPPLAGRPAGRPPTRRAAPRRR